MTSQLGASSSMLDSWQTARLTKLCAPLSATMEELLALRKLRKAKGGIDLHRLNEGEKKKRKRKKVDEGADTGAAGYGMQSSREERIEDEYV